MCCCLCPPCPPYTLPLLQPSAWPGEASTAGEDAQPCAWCVATTRPCSSLPWGGGRSWSSHTFQMMPGICILYEWPISYELITNKAFEIYYANQRKCLCEHLVCTSGLREAQRVFPSCLPPWHLPRIHLTPIFVHRLCVRHHSVLGTRQIELRQIPALCGPHSRRRGRQ